MSKSVSSSSSSGTGLCGMLFILFLTLKLLEVTVVSGWSWWWVTAPLWIPTVLVAAIGLAVVVGMGIPLVISWFIHRKEG